jgi:elongator complex protein 2
MILAASWAPGTAGRVFATGGRDKVIKIWKLTDEGVGCLQSITTEVPITALAFLPELVGGRSQLTYGLETGQLIICSIATTDDFAVGTYDKDAILQQSNAVTQLAWRPKQRGEDKAAVNGHGPERWQLAIASADSSIHIASIELDGRNSQKPDL